MQSRMCFTLCEERELFERFARGYSPSPQSDRPQRVASHTDLFGPFSLAVNVPAARQIGILPTAYYSPVDANGRRYSAPGGRPGLHLQIIQKLKELRDLSVVLSIVERSLPVGGQRLPAEEMLKALSIDLPYQPEILAKAYRLSETQRHELFQLFNTDRESALDLVGFIDMMLSLFQETDSFRDDSPLAFYQQREWRLIHHMRKGAMWYCLGPQPAFRNPLAPERSDAIRNLRNTIDTVGGRARNDEWFRSCWILESLDGTPLRDFVSALIVPNRHLTRVAEIVEEFECKARLVAAEEFGYEDPLL